MNIKKKHLLIDAKNMLYRACYTAIYDNRFQQSGNHVMNIVLHFMCDYYNKFSPDQVHVFWDSARSDTWRKKLNPEYKEGRGGSSKVSDTDLHDMISNLTEIGTLMFKYMGIRQYYQDNMEADDLIYAFCRVNTSDNIIIVSSDTDLKQITYRFPNVKIHSHLSKTKAEFEPTPTIDPVILKCFVGDKSDNINGYYRIGPVKATILVEDLEKRHDFFMSDGARVKTGDEIKVVGDEKFKENLLLIDLSLCPYLLDNMIYVFRKQFKPIKFDISKIFEIIGKFKIKGLTSDISKYVSPFKKLTQI